MTKKAIALQIAGITMMLIPILMFAPILSLIQNILNFAIIFLTVAAICNVAGIRLLAYAGWYSTRR